MHSKIGLWIVLLVMGLLLLGCGEATDAEATPTIGTQGEGPPDSGEVATLCGAEETIVLSCQIAGSDKVLSLCASDPVGPDGFLQYRFGEGTDRLEQQYPEEVANSLEAFFYDEGNLSDGTTLSFSSAAHLYRIYQTEQGTGLKIDDPGGETMDYPCGPASIGRLTLLEGLVPLDIGVDEPTGVNLNETLATLIVTFGDEPPSEMPIVYIHEVDTGAFYKEEMGIGPGMNQLTLTVEPGRYHLYARSTVFEDISYWGYWQDEDGLALLESEPGQLYTQVMLTRPPDPCKAAYQLPASPDGLYPSTDDPALAQRWGCDGAQGTPSTP